MLTSHANILARIMRCLCSIHIFQEIGPDVFGNNAISELLVNNEPLRAYILLLALTCASALDLYTSSDYLPKTLYDEKKGPSYKVDETAWQEATGTTKPRWDWLEETISVVELSSGSRNARATVAYPGVFGSELKNAISRAADNRDQIIKRPEHAIFSLAMVGGGQVTGRAHLHDFPWASLGSATVVDVGGGVGKSPSRGNSRVLSESMLMDECPTGGFCLQLSQLYPDLKFVLQDRGDAIEKARSEVWPRENAAALESGRIDFEVHDFFDVNPVRGADVYWLRYVLHNWSDDYCVRILGAIKESMGPRSRVLICGCRELTPAPAPLLANWGYSTRYSHQRDLAMMAIINGIERKPEEFRALAERAGLYLRKIWDCRSQVGLVEMVLPDS
ncbi:Sterigmatocystin 8-O-methyltransferase [Tolypocladium ophioglossoides CBS 100239]|uniref:Sterigmatocystin 8-O-methyltransferase n=1 Tax=Tolypocladium ophioglossoides (strain CBS 100239) TaxID=1163406 RepID=A0A0L0N4S1_TOLOC|nr:Sterigmatocystin 8-O-methyltransferase [Tolypocladium ophioglossoides CBS 100239]